MNNYSELIRRISDRYNPEHERLVESRMFSVLSERDAEVVKYVRLAMNEVDSSFTQRVLDAGNAVKKTLSLEQSDVQYEFQGSVMTKTHIRAASDIDLLTITSKFSDTEINKIKSELQRSALYSDKELYELKKYSDSFNRYMGYSLQDLRDLRKENEEILTKNYKKVDITKPKSIKVHPMAYRIDVDVVIASWYDSFDYARYGQNKIYRGISIYNKKDDKQENPSLPFLAIERINQRSIETQGRLKKMIRFLKNVKEDSDQKINLTSFEINAICYNIPVLKYHQASYLELVGILWNELYEISKDINFASQIKSVDGTEYVFIKNPDRYPHVKLLKERVWEIYHQLLNV